MSNCRSSLTQRIAPHTHIGGKRSDRYAARHKTARSSRPTISRRSDARRSSGRVAKTAVAPHEQRRRARHRDSRRGASARSLLDDQSPKCAARPRPLRIGGDCRDRRHAGGQYSHVYGPYRSQKCHLTVQERGRRCRGDRRGPCSGRFAPGISLEVLVLAVAPLALTLIDVIHVHRRAIAPIYLACALIEALLICRLARGVLARLPP